MPDVPETETSESPSETRYKVGEVCRLADVQPYVLRYWENEFPVLAPDRSQQGPRTYSERDLVVIQRIKTLLYVEGFTIAGAKKRLDTELKNGGPAPELQGTDTAPVTAIELASPPEQKPKRTRTRPVSVTRSADPELPEIFEENVGEPRAEESPKVSTEVRTGRVSPPPVDPRLPRVVSELRKLLEILSRP